MILKEKYKHKGHKSCEQNRNQGIPTFVEEERWDANRGIPKLELLPLFYSSHIGNFSFFEHFIHTKLNKNYVRSVSIIKQITTFRYCCKLIPISYYHYIYCIPTLPWFIPPDTTHRFIKISEQHIENRICRKQDSL